MHVVPRGFHRATLRKPSQRRFACSHSLMFVANAVVINGFSVLCSVVASRRVWPAQHVVPTVHNVQVSATELVTGRVGREQDDANLV